MTINNKLGKRIEAIIVIMSLHFRLFYRPKIVTKFKGRDYGVILLPFEGTEEAHGSSHSEEGVFIYFDRTLVVRRTTQLERIVTTG